MTATAGLLVVSLLTLVLLPAVADASTGSPRIGPFKRYAAVKTRPTVVAPALGKHVRFGAFAEGFTGAGTQVTQLERQLGAPVAIASSFRGPTDVFPSGDQVTDAASGHALLISWYLGDTAADRFSTFTAGAHDDYLRSVAAASRDLGRPIYLRPWAEMNADWVPFQPTADGSRVAGGTPAEFIAAWRHVVTVFRTAGATNVKWVFNPTTDTYAETTDVRTVYPGATYVDVLGLDGYNWGNGGRLTWRTFADVYTTQYKRLVALQPGAPVWVCEFGSKEPRVDDGAPVDAAHSKATWYDEALASTAFPAVPAMVLFDIKKERDWRVASDPRALQAVATAAKTAAAAGLATAP